MQAPGAEALQHTSAPPTTGKPWQDICADVQTYRDATVEAVFPALSSLTASDLPLNVTGVPADVLTSEEIRITSLPVEELLSLLASRELSCVETTNAFLKRAAVAQHLVNCVTELLPERAHARAQYLDEYITTHSKPIGPLHGLPISVKEHVSMEGLDCNAGFVSWVGRVAQEDALILKILWEAGAVFYVRTTEPQTIVCLSMSCIASLHIGKVANPITDAPGDEQQPLWRYGQSVQSTPHFWWLFRWGRCIDRVAWQLSWNWYEVGWSILKDYY